jgi:GT2 family glycosyltransferase
VLRRSLESLFAQRGLEDFAVELVIVDDGSTDDTAAVLEQLRNLSPFPMTVLRGTKRGVAAARNLAAGSANGRWLASFDDDQLASPLWLHHLIACANAQGAGCVGGAMVLNLPPGTSLSQFGPRARGLLGEIAPSGVACPYPANALPATNNALVRRDVFDALGGYDMRFTEGGEDTDFFGRMRRAGYSIWFEPTALADHLIPPTRITPQALGNTAMRIGTVEARIEHLQRPWLAPLRLAAVRIAVALIRDLPLLAVSTITHNSVTHLEAALSLRFTFGLLRALPSLGRGHSRFLASMDFRIRHGEREDPTARP